MEIFSAGNIITFIAVMAALVIFRLNDRRNRNLQAAREYGRQLERQLKDDLAQYVDKKKNEIINCGARLSAEKSAAKALLDNIEEKITQFRERTANLGAVNQRLVSYDNMISELLAMTGRVEDNLKRIACEDEFVEKTAVNVEEAKLKFLELIQNVKESRDTLEYNMTDSLGMLKNCANEGKNQIEEITKLQHEKIEKAEKELAANVERDTQKINKLLKEAIDHAGERAGKLEDEIYREFRAQTEERAARLREDIDTALSQSRTLAQDGLDSLKQSVEKELDELRKGAEELRSAADGIGALEKSIRERAIALEEEVRENKTTAEKDIRETKSALEKEVRENKNTLEKEVRDIKLEIEKNISAYSTEIEKKISERNNELDRQFEIYEQRAKSAATAMNAELHFQLESAEEHITKHIAASINEAGEKGGRVIAELNETLARMREKISGIEQDIDSIKRDAYERTEENIKRFEEGFVSNLSRRNEQFEHRFAEWRDSLNSRFETLDENREAECRRIETVFTESLRKKSAELDTAFMGEMERIRGGAQSIEEGARKQMEEAETALSSLKDELKTEIAALRESTIAQLNTEIGRNELEASDKIKNFWREIDDTLRSHGADIDAFNSKMEELRKRCKEVVSENDDKLGAIQNTVDELSSVLARYAEQKTHITREIEDMRGELQRLELQKADIAGLEVQFTKIRRMEDDVNAKMTRFLTEQRRVELMEEDFKRLLNTAAQVNDKLSELTENNDTLQELQLQFRKLTGAMGETEERYQRIEKKNQVLEETIECIDKNFMSMQESEKTAKQLEAAISHLSAELTEIRSAIESLTSDYAHVVETSEKLDTLDAKLLEIEERMEALQKARQWAASLEERLIKLNKEARVLVNASETNLKHENDTGYLNPKVNPKLRDTVRGLKRQGWAINEIAVNQGIAESTVELILETEIPSGK
ncbi:MAG: hypothetical protein LBC77_01070 [Spirochaetaceae bacterium]|jgi:DNA repair exonuclease SbcCD ATPase subunit|nr:hypothetical protein [Spirochaetaceae bacterium]